MFQSNQLIAQTIVSFPSLDGYQLWLGVVTAILVGVVILGGIKGIADVKPRISLIELRDVVGQTQSHRN